MKKKLFAFDEKLKVLQDLTNYESNRLRGGTDGGTTRPPGCKCEGKCECPIYDGGYLPEVVITPAPPLPQITVTIR